MFIQKIFKINYHPHQIRIPKNTQCPGSSEYTDDETDDDDIKLVQVPEDKLIGTMIGLKLMALPTPS